MFNKFKIDFIVVGTQKAGTSAIDYYLRQHQKIAMASQKELHFFDDDSLFLDNKVDYSILKNYFPNKNQKKLFGEVTPSYMYWNESVLRIKQYNPHIKLIAILRNPVDRAFSNWNMEMVRNNESRPFKVCIDEEMHQIINNKKEKNLYGSYVDRGLYAKQIKNMLKHFPSKQLLFIKYEDYIENQIEIMNRIFAFLGVDTCENDFQLKSLHKIEYLKNMTSEERDALVSFYKNDIAEVEKLLKWDCSDWN